LPIIAIRPEPGCAATVAAGLAMGLAIAGYPLFAVEPLAWQAPDTAQIDAVLAGSANAFRHGGSVLDRFRDKPVYAVGQATAESARTAGFAVAATGSGGLQTLLDSAVPQGLRLLRLSGEDHVPVNAPPTITIVTRIAYVSRALPIGAAMAGQLADGALVLLHSAVAARQLADECDRLGLARSHIRLAALGPRIADAAGQGWRALASAASPDDAALLALARELCQ
jgi:uroporphyrinogen-III synthase